MSFASKILVLLQLTCLVYLLIFTKFIGQGIFLTAQISGFILSLWAVIIMRPGYFNIQPEVKSNANFINSGPYRVIRNPMYTGLIVFFGSGMVNSFRPSSFLVYLLLVFVLIFKIKLEEKFLENRFGSAYLEYKSKTYRLFPYLF